ncbi:TPM domain-containing protein [Maledivibacter halophilus]|uniref:TPM domain-containing protein n=1 Tax=Maledivibacter halophilus TaxID=36842 RepID=A0A1T5JEN1_9FIRM|nr:TPM domain-containing protein [Maledivibacter halophilus]SKC49921.1 uncharacterized protein SAMN02194393_01143 [Maledivibacter halophilus]
MFKRKAISVLTLIFVLLSSIIVFSQTELPRPAQEFYVADYAGVLSQDVKQIIRDTNLKYEATPEAPQIVVATVPNMQGMDVVTYTVELFEEWQIGNKEYSNGVLLLLSLEERNVRIEVGYGLEGAISDSKTGDILDSVIPQLSEGNYSEGLLSAFYQIVEEVNTEYGYEDSAIIDKSTRDNLTPRNNTSTNRRISTLGNAIIALFILALIWFDSKFLGGFILRTILWLLFFGRGGGRGGGGFGGGSFGGGGRSGGGGADREF